MLLSPCSLQPLVPFYDLKRPIAWQDFFKNDLPLQVEIGFGMGEVLIRSAQEKRDTNFIGIEEHWERIYKTLKSVSRLNAGPLNKQPLENIGILRVDARVAFERLFPPQSLQRIFSLFPCPWPKKSHIKHRLFSKKFIQLLNSRLIDGGELYIVTDYEPYYQWMLEEVEQTGFLIRKDIIKARFDTKFEKKWRAAGQEEFYELLLVKEEHFDRVVQEDVQMKSFKLENFDPRQFRFENETGQYNLIFKDYIYDENKQEAQVSLLVAEQHMTQPVRIVIVKKDGFWRVRKADYQTFFPTPGVARAIQSVYEQAKNFTVLPS